MAQEYKDYVSANGGIEGQVTPTYMTPGVLSTAATVAAMVTGAGVPGLNTVVQAEQVLAVASAYFAPGSRLAV